MTTEIDTATLKALRNADTIVFRWSEPDRGEGFTPGSFIEATKKHNPGDGFGDRDLTVSVAVERPIITNYGPAATAVGACSVFSSAKFYPELVTAFACIKPGDILQPEYTLDNNTDIAREHGLHFDEVRLRVRRGDRMILTFLLQTHVYPPNPMIRDVSLVVA